MKKKKKLKIRSKSEVTVRHHRTMGSFGIDKGNGNDNAKNENLIGRMKKKKRAARGTQLFIFLYI